MTARAGGSRASRFALLATVGSLTAVGPFGTDLYLPALPQMGAQLGAPDEAAQFTLTAYLVGLGVGQFLWGPVSDRIGRRLPLLIGMSVFALASAAGAVITSVSALIAVRLAMGLAGSAGIVVGRAVVRDLYSGEDLARIFSRLSIAIGAAPVVAPVVGGALLQVTDWRGTFVALAVLGGAFVLATALWVPETLPAGRRNRRRGSPRPAGSGFSRIRAGGPRFVVWTVVLVGSTVTMITYITFISLVLQVERGVGSFAFALIFALNALGTIVGGQLGGFLVRRFRAHRIVLVSQCVNLLAAAAVLLASVYAWPLWAFQAALFAVILQAGLCNPLSTALALQPFEHGAGSASAVVGGSQFTIGALLPSLIAATAGAGATTMSTTILTSAAATLTLVIIGARVLRRHHTAEPSSLGEEALAPSGE